MDWRADALLCRCSHATVKLIIDELWGRMERHQKGKRNACVRCKDRTTAPVALQQTWFVSPQIARLSWWTSSSAKNIYCMKHWSEYEATYQQCKQFVSGRERVNVLWSRKRESKEWGRAGGRRESRRKRRGRRLQSLLRVCLHLSSVCVRVRVNSRRQQHLNGDAGSMSGGRHVSRLRASGRKCTITARCWEVVY